MHDHLLIAVYALAGLAAVEAAALAVLGRLLYRIRAENEALRQQPDLLSFGSKAVKTMWQTASLVRADVPHRHAGLARELLDRQPIDDRIVATRIRIGGVRTRMGGVDVRLVRECGWCGLGGGHARGS